MAAPTVPPPLTGAHGFTGEERVLLLMTIVKKQRGRDDGGEVVEQAEEKRVETEATAQQT